MAFKSDKAKEFLSNLVLGAGSGGIPVDGDKGAKTLLISKGLWPEERVTQAALVNSVGVRRMGSNWVHKSFVEPVRQERNGPKVVVPEISIPVIQPSVPKLQFDSQEFILGGGDVTLTSSRFQGTLKDVYKVTAFWLKKGT